MSFGSDILRHLTEEGFEIDTVRVDKESSVHGRGVNKIRVNTVDGAQHHFEFAKDLALDGKAVGTIIASIMRKERV